MSRCILMIGMLLGAVAFSPSANAQGLWFGGFGIGSPGFSSLGFSSSSFYRYGVGGPGLYGLYAPAAYGYPLGWNRVSPVRPVLYGVAPPRPVYAARPAVALPLNRAYRRVWRRGW